MRIPIAVHVEPFDIDGVQPQIDLAREAFARYLDEVPRKSTRSKHGLMGPVGKILNEVKSGRHDPASLKGYAVRVHEASGRSPSPGGLAALEEGIDSLLALLGQSPITVHDRILDRLDYGLYFSLRKASLEQREQLNARFQDFLLSHYPGIEALGDSWGEKLMLGRIYVFGPTSATWKKANQVKRADMAKFWEQARADAGANAQAVLDEEDEDDA